MERANRTIYDRIRHCEVMTIQEIAFINNGQNQTFYNNLRSLCKRDRSFFFFSFRGRKRIYICINSRSR